MLKNVDKKYVTLCNKSLKLPEQVLNIQDMTSLILQRKTYPAETFRLIIFTNIFVPKKYEI